ncbi:MAG: hypothetical protein ACUVXI_18645 [bacterium]
MVRRVLFPLLIAIPASAPLSYADLTKEDLKEIEEIVTRVVESRLAMLDAKITEIE